MQTVKVSYRDEIRRLKADLNSNAVFDSLLASVREAFKLAPSAKLTLKYHDNEGDVVTISSSPELQEAFRNALDEQRRNLKLFIFDDANELPPSRAESDASSDITSVSDAGFVEVSQASALPAVPEVEEKNKKAAEPERQPLLAPAPDSSDVTVEDVSSEEDIYAEAAKEFVAESLRQASPDTKEEVKKPEPQPQCNLAELLPELLVFLQEPQVKEAVKTLLPSLFDSVTSPDFKPSAVAEVLLANPVISTHPFIERVRPCLPTLLPQLDQFKERAGCLLSQGLSLVSAMCNPTGEDREFHLDIPMWLPLQLQSMLAPRAPAAPASAPRPTVSADGKAIHNGVSCDGCGMYPILGARYKCSVCPNYDLCDACEAKGDVHPGEHVLMKIARPPAEYDEQGRAIHRGYSCDGCNASPIVGIRYNCAKCPNFDLCEQCEASGVHPGDHGLLKIRSPVRPSLPAHPLAFLRRGAGRRGGCPRRGGAGAGCPFLRTNASAVPSAEEAVFNLGRRCHRRRQQGLSAVFVSDYTIPDKSYCLPKAVLKKTWVLRNTSAAPWPAGTVVAFVKGDVVPAAGAQFKAPVESVASGETGHVSVDVQIPEKEGHFFGYYTLEHDGKSFGPEIWVEVVVPGSQASTAEQKEQTTALPLPKRAVAAAAPDTKDAPVSAAPVKSEAAAVLPAVQPAAAPSVPKEIAPVSVPAPVVAAPVAVPEPAPVVPAAPEFPQQYNKEHRALFGMGFSDIAVNAQLLRTHRGNVEVVVDTLLSRIA